MVKKTVLSTTTQRNHSGQSHCEKNNALKQNDAAGADATNDSTHGPLPELGKEKSLQFVDPAPLG